MVPVISYLSNVQFAAGAARIAAQIVSKLGIERPLIVTDAGVRSAGLVEPLGVAGAMFEDVPSNPTEQSVDEGLSVYRQHGCDGIVAVGGGSPMDCAKCIALLATHAAPLEQYAMIRGGMERIGASKPPVLCVPTTAGSGSEVGRAALIVMNSGAKLAILSPHLVPQAVICDPQLTTGMPPALTAATGMDAISHCIESFCSPRFNPVADAIALDGLRRGWRHIRVAVADGSKVDARGEMMMAALQGGLTFQKGLGAVHALSHAAGSLAHRRLHHGTLNAIFLPHVLRFNASSCRERIGALAAAVGLASPDDLATACEALIDSIGLPRRLRELGVSPDDLKTLPPQAAADHCTSTNPRRADARDYQQLFEAAM